MSAYLADARVVARRARFWGRWLAVTLTLTFLILFTMPPLVPLAVAVVLAPAALEPLWQRFSKISRSDAA